MTSARAVIALAVRKLAADHQMPPPPEPSLWTEHRPRYTPVRTTKERPAARFSKNGDQVREGGDLVVGHDATVIVTGGRLLQNDAIAIPRRPD
jgi:hypothetical protein